MSAKSIVIIACLAVLPVIGAGAQAAAQTPSARRVAHPHVEVNPRPLLYRRCASWYVVQYRPSGTVLFPEKHCWWVRG